jgi:hypothetical protein
MRISVDIPPDIERLLLEKCKESKLSPSDFVSALLEWYFLKRKKMKPDSEFAAYALRVGRERVKTCRYSDGKFCALDTLGNIMEESDPEPLSPYRCVFCNEYMDRRREKLREKIEVGDEVIEIARIAARLVVELYGDKLGYRPKLTVESVEKEKGITGEGVKKLLDW